MFSQGLYGVFININRIFFLYIWPKFGEWQYTEYINYMLGKI